MLFLEAVVQKMCFDRSTKERGRIKCEKRLDRISIKFGNKINIAI